MKRVYFALAVLIMAALTGCQVNEFRNDTYTPEKGEIVFRLANSKATKSLDASVTVKGVTIPLGDDGSGHKLFLEETITRLDDISYGPQTKGTPAYTENFADLYGDFKAAAFKTTSSSFESSAFDDGVFEKVSGSEIEMWKRKFGDDLDEHFPLYFFLRAPYAQEGSTVTKLRYFPTAKGDTLAGAIAFKYDGSSLTSAANQKDLLFTSRKVTLDEYEDLIDKSEGIPVLFHHALTGIKFANFFDNPDLDTKTYITKVEITGLADGGECVITPRTETNGYVDDKTGDFSSSEVTVWNPAKLTYGQNVVYTQSFNDSADEIDFPEEGSFGENGSYTGTSFGKAGAANNLNKADGSLTFWFVPQQLTENVKMTVYYKVINTKNGNATHEAHDTINFGDLTRIKTGEETITDEDGKETTRPIYGAYANWKAGELRTYTLKPQYVEIELVDKMSDYEKDSVKVTNNGNVYEYVRVNLIANWVGLVQIDENVFEPDTTILNGYVSATSNEMVEAWNDKDGKTNYGTFVDLVPKSKQIPATADSTYNNWVRYDKYYYYTKPIGPNESVTDQLFTSYTVGVSPEFWIVDKWGVRRKAGHVHLIMDVMCQAIPASTDINGNITDNYIDAWVKALGKDDPEDLLDL